MAKGSVRKKGKKWYYRFYVEDASGKMVQKEYAGTESKSETEKLLRKALEDYEDKKFVAKADNLTVGELLDMWAEEELKTGTLSNGTVENYLGAIRCIKKHPIADRKLKTVTAEHLQAFLDLLTFGGEFPDGKVRKGYSKDYIHSFSAVLQQSFRFAVFPKQLISFNPMQYIKPVSYTHLDVYKRQVISCSRCSASALIPAIADSRFPTVRFWFSVARSVRAVLLYLAKDSAARIIRCLSFLNSCSAPEKTGAVDPVPAIPVPSLQ